MCNLCKIALSESLDVYAEQSEQPDEVKDQIWSTFVWLKFATDRLKFHNHILTIEGAFVVPFCVCGILTKF